MYRKIDDFTTEWKYESASTLKLFDALNDESIHTTSLGDVRKIGRLSWHIIYTLHEMMNRTGMNIPAIDEGAIPETAKEIRDTYQRLSDALISEISKWTDADLEKEDDMYGQMWKRGTTLSILIKHQAHHRGQLTVLMRQAGLKVVGVYGPAREEWAAYGMPTMD